MGTSLLFEGKNYLLLNKPSGLVVHSDGRTKEDTLVDWLLDKYPKIKGVGESMFIKKDDQEIKIERSGIVHRLDRETSGVMIIARNQEAFEVLKEKFQKREVSKTYLAFVYGAPKAKKGVIDAPIGRSPKDFRRWSAQQGARGNLREAVTEWRVLFSFEDNKKEIFSLVEFRPQTGRTHQIRVHAKYMHHPIVSDSLYSGKRKEALGFDRQALHARHISFVWEGEHVEGTAELPHDFKKVFSNYDIDPLILEK